MTALPIFKDGIGASPKAQPDRIGRGERLAYLAAFAVLICVRLPDVLLEGRFWAEEGRDFFHKAWTLPWSQALFAPHEGYLNIIANGGALLARYLVPLEFAPYVTTAIGLLFQLCPALVLLTARDDWLQRRVVLVLALLLILLPPSSEEVWLQTLHSQFHLALCAALILTLKSETGWIEIFRRGLLLIGALSGPGAAVLLPLFVLRAILDRSSPRAMEALVLGIGVALQFVLFYTAIPQRNHPMTLPLLLSVITAHHIVLPLMGTEAAKSILSDLYRTVMSGPVPLWSQIAAVCAFVLMVTGLVLRRQADFVWLFLAGCTVMVVSYSGALVDLVTLIAVDGAPRYGYVPQAIFNLVVLGLAATGHDVLAKLAWGLVAWIVVTGAQSYFFTWDIISHGPDWRSELAIWRTDPSHKLKIWPGGWEMALPREGADPPPQSRP